METKIGTITGDISFDEIASGNVCLSTFGFEYDAEDNAWLETRRKYLDKIENRYRAAACHYIKLDSDAQFRRLISMQTKILMFSPLC